MKVVKQFSIILSALFIGYFLERFFKIPMPANVLGMIILFLALYIKIIKLEDVKEVGDFIIKHLAIFYVVPSVGIMVYLDLLKTNFLVIIVPVLISIVLGFFVAGKVTEIMIKKESKE